MTLKFFSTTFLMVMLTGIFSANTVTNRSQSTSVLYTIRPEVAHKKSIIRLYPNPTWDGNISISSHTSAERVNFYIFDLDGTMVHQTELKENQKHKVNNLKKGIYMYDVFVNDTSIEQGRIVVK